jgi:hypothetical protein
MQERDVWGTRRLGLKERDEPCDAAAEVSEVSGAGDGGCEARVEAFLEGR